ncbi:MULTISPECIES: DegT/DnrJ/EryC1/StrS family aminotransferase [Nocardioides]|uniref:DegT/DnrJ/EryC1/StrS family aminotransferase n=1 Tax=Nocardioides vastitatis TaxID=2568655 RepID=A0ABW0ZKH3_9ACTN|nr:DegT/DnrJ/EryC1/StrS family aminotransferase [Nocardioides sp.]
MTSILEQRAQIPDIDMVARCICPSAVEAAITPITCSVAAAE